MEEKRLFAHEKNSPLEADICGAAIDLINAQLSPTKSISVATIFIEPGKASRPHYHKVMEEIYYFISGRGKVSVGDQNFEVDAGAAVLIPIGKLHQVANTGSVQLKFISADSPSFDPADIYYP